MRKTILLTAMLLAIAGGMQAANKLTVTTEPETVVSGVPFELVISMENDIDVSAYDFHLYLPPDARLVYDDAEEDFLYTLSDRHNRKHQLTIKYDATDDSFLLGVADPDLHMLKGNSGEVIRLTMIVAAEELPDIFYGSIRKVWFAESGSSGVEVEDVYFEIATAIHDVMQDAAAAPHYTPDGKRVAKLTKGVYDKMIISTGLANTAGVIPRLFNPTEIVFLDNKNSAHRT